MDLSSLIRLYANLASFFTSVRFSRGPKWVSFLARIYLRDACSCLMTVYQPKELDLNQNTLTYLP